MLCDEVWDIATAIDGSLYVTGYTNSNDFPTKKAYDNKYSSWGDAFVVKFDSTGSLQWSSFLGGCDVDRAYAVEISTVGNCYVTGYTGSPDFPIKKANSDTLKGAFDIFVSEFSFKGNLLWSTYLGGSQVDEGNNIDVTNDGRCFIVGTTYSSNFPTKDAFDNNLGATRDAFVAIFNNTHNQSTHTYADVGFLIFVAVLPAITFIIIITIILLKKRK